MSDSENAEPHEISLDSIFVPLDVVGCVMGDFGLEHADSSEAHVLYWETDRARGPVAILPLRDGKIGAAEMVDALKRRGITMERAMASLAHCALGAQITLVAPRPSD